MATKKSAPLDTSEVGVAPTPSVELSGITVLRAEITSLPLASQINTLLDEVERLAQVK